ncbi:MULTISPECIES: DUF2971 domain-containing protein [Agrobacterium]|nr:DUF2971 domain-containing protein [Agrobacterium larrymoorei]
MKLLNMWSDNSGPTHFYKFRGVSDFTKMIVTRNELYFGSAEDFNDPFDFLPIFTMDGSPTQVKEYLANTQEGRSRSDKRKFAAQIMKDPKYRDYVREALQVAEAELAKVRKSTGLFCLAARADHILLWGHYADSHRGIALRFKPQKGDGFFETACKVSYEKDRPKLSFVQHDTVMLHKLALLTKADFWSYEDEWRIVKETGSKGPHKFAASALDGIVLGAKISDEDERKVRDWVAEAGLNVEWLRASIHKDTFSLEIGNG